MSGTFFENYAISNEIYIEQSDINVKPIHKHRQVSRRDREPSKIPIRTVERLKNKNRKVSMFVSGGQFKYTQIQIVYVLMSHESSKTKEKQKIFYLNALI